MNRKNWLGLMAVVLWVGLIGLAAGGNLGYQYNPRPWSDRWLRLSTTGWVGQVTLQLTNQAGRILVGNNTNFPLWTNAIGLVSLVAGDVQVTNSLAAKTVVVTNTIDAATGRFGDAAITNSLTAKAAVVTNALDAATVRGGDVAVTNSLTANSGVVTNTLGMLTANIGTANVTNGVLANTLLATNTVDGATGRFGDVAVTNSLTAKAAVVTNAIDAATLRVGDATVTNALTANTATVTNAFYVGSVAVGDLAVTNNLTAKAAVVTNDVSSASMTTGNGYVTNLLSAKAVISTNYVAGLSGTFGTLAVTNSAAVNSLVSTGAVSGLSGTFGDLASTNNLTAKEGVITNTLGALTLNVGTANVTNGVLASSVAVTNGVTAATVDAGTSVGTAALVATNSIKTAALDAGTSIGTAALIATNSVKTATLDAGTSVGTAAVVATNTVNTATLNAGTAVLAAAVTATNALSGATVTGTTSVSTPTLTVGGVTVTNDLAAATVNAGTSVGTAALTATNSVKSASGDFGTSVGTAALTATNSVATATLSAGTSVSTAAGVFTNTVDTATLRATDIAATNGLTAHVATVTNLLSVGSLNAATNVGAATGWFTNTIYGGTNGNVVAKVDSTQTNYFGFDAGSATYAGAVYNLGIGQGALGALTTADYNVALGCRALSSDGLSQGRHTAVGFEALKNLNHAAATYNTAVGYRSMHDAVSGYDNTAIGGDALHANNGTTAMANVAVGVNCLMSKISGALNTGLGYGAGVSLTNGWANLFIGANAADALIDGSSNIVIGYSATLPTTTSNQRLNIGNLIYGDMANRRVGIGTEGTTNALDVTGSAVVANGLGVGTNAPSAGAQIMGNPTGLAFSVNGQQLAVTNGNVAMGTTKATARLTVVATDSSGYAFTTRPVGIFADANPELGILDTGNTAGNTATLRLGPVHTNYYNMGAFVQGRQYAGLNYWELHLGTANGATSTTALSISRLGDVGIGRTNPAAKLDIDGNLTMHGSIQVTNNGVTLLNYSNTTHQVFDCLNSRGWMDAPTYLLKDDEVGAIAFREGTSGTRAGGFGISVYADEDWSAGALGSYGKFFTTPNGSTTKTPYLEVHNDGVMSVLQIPKFVLGIATHSATVTNGVGIGIAAPTAGLHLAGTLALTNSGANANSYALRMVANNAGTQQTGTVHVVYGADPYMRFSAPAPAGDATAVLDLHTNALVAVTDNTLDIGAANANRPKDGWFAGTISGTAVRGGSVTGTNSLTVTGTVALLTTTGGAATLGAHHTYFLNADADVKLPDPTTCANREYWIKTIAPATTTARVITHVETELFPDTGLTNYTFSNSNKWLKVVSDGTHWQQFPGP